MALPLTELSAWLVASMVVLAALGNIAGAVYKPVLVIVPAVEFPPGTPLTLQATVELKLPVPVTVAVHCEVCPIATEAGVHETPTDVMVGGGGVRVIVAEADFVGSAMLVAVSVTVAAVLTTGGAV